MPTPRYTMVQNAMMKSTTKLWRVIDCKGLKPGFIVTAISRYITGKHKPIYHATEDLGDRVVCINTKYTDLSDPKWKYKHFASWTGTKIKQVYLKDMSPTVLLKKLLYRMMPKNRRRQALCQHRVYYFEDDNHPYKNVINTQIKTFADVSWQEYHERFPGKHPEHRLYYEFDNKLESFKLETKIDLDSK